MARTDDPYSRLYWRLREDPIFERVYKDDAALGLWARLLMEADAAYPMKQSLPRSTRALKLLVEVGLIIPVANGLYTVRGLGKERDRRSEQGRNAVAQRKDRAGDSTPVVRTYNGSNTPVVLTTTSNQQPQPQPEPQPEPGARDDDDLPITAIGAYVFVNGNRMPKAEAKAWITELVKDHGEERVRDTIYAEWRKDQSRATLIGRVEAAIATQIVAREEREARIRAEDRERAREATQREYRSATPEERERADALRKAIKIGMKMGGPKPIPTTVEGATEYVKAWEEQHGSVG